MASNMDKLYCEHVYCPKGCTVPSGKCETCVKADRSSLAREILEAVEAEIKIVPIHSESFVGYKRGFEAGVVNALAAIRNVLSQRGVEVDENK